MLEHEVGEKITYNAYTSFTKGERYNESSQVEIKVLSSKGKDLSNINSAEQEILYERNAVFHDTLIITRKGREYKKKPTRPDKNRLFPGKQTVFPAESEAQMSQKPPAAPCDVRIGPVEVAAVPGVGDVTGGVGEVQQQFQLALRVGLQNAHGVGQIVRLHGQQIVVPVIVLPPQLPSGLPSGGDAVPRQLPHRRRVHRVADLLPTGGRGGDVKLVRDAAGGHHVF